MPYLSAQYQKQKPNQLTLTQTPTSPLGPISSQPNKNQTNFYIPNYRSQPKPQARLPFETLKQHPK